MLAKLITFAHFAVASAMGLPNLFGRHRHWLNA